MTAPDPIDVILAITLALATVLVAAILRLQSSKGLELETTTPVVIDEPSGTPIAKLKVIELRKLAREKGVGTSYLCASGRRNDLLEALTKAGISHA